MMLELYLVIIDQLMTSEKTTKHLIPFILITCLFFLWGFANNLVPILIPHLKKSFTLTTTQSTLVESAVYIAYFFMALPAGMVMKRLGYKTGIIIGLLLFAVGAFLFVPAANNQSYLYFLFASFVIASGLTILETAANPYASALGDPSSSTQRLNLAQSFNGLAAFLAPAIGARVILTKGNSDAELSAMSESVRQAALASEAYTVKTPYTILGIVLIIIAVLFYLVKLPDIRTKKEGGEKATVLGTFKHAHLKWAVVTQFFYVGAQVCVGSFFIKMARTGAGMDEKTAAQYLGWGYGAAFMIGRFVGTFLMGRFASEKLLSAYALINIVLSAVAIFGSGIVVVYALIAIAFFMSIMFPTIFSLGIKEVGADTKMASSLIVMSIVGGAFLPPVLGIISDATGSIQNGYIVPLLCFVVVFLFANKGYKVKSV